jgi:RimJ/RimL family protein N-acetyltransferase
MNDHVDGLRLTTSRLELVASTIALADAELTNRPALEHMLNAVLAPDWPAPLNGRETVRYVFKQLRRAPADAGWWSWYVLRRTGDDDEGAVAIGTAGFKGAPDDEGTIEIGYAIVESHQRQGCASEAVAALVDWAFAQPNVQRVIAETLPSLGGSIRVLERNGFAIAGAGSEDGVLRYARQRA